MLNSSVPSGNGLGYMDAARMLQQFSALNKTDCKLAIGQNAVPYGD